MNQHQGGLAREAVAGELPARRPAVLGRVRWATLAPWLVLELQLGLLVLVIRQFHLENRALLLLVVVAFAGFTIQAVLPPRLRLPFFLLLSLTGIGLVMGVTTGATLVGIGLVLVGACHLPLPLWQRVAVLLALGTILALMRAALLPLPFSLALWPILGSMFMFRLIVYVYDLAHDRTPVSATRSLSYFFLLPNVCFPLFPVVDFKTFRRTYDPAVPTAVSQVGLQWILRGIVHLILYRAVYYHALIAPGDVDGPGELVRFLVTNFLLYLRVSGQFHLAIGILHLFGFDLPETNHGWALASSFTDFWRRINIYWKDFMLKVFYYPAYFRLRRGGETRALVLATLAVFVVTWFLHSYQWFWLRGSFPVKWQDLLFWGALAALVVHASLREARRGRARSLGARTRSAGERAVLVLRTVGTFAAVCVLWSIWTASSLSEWLGMWAGALHGVRSGDTLAGVAQLGSLAGVAAVAALTSGGGTPRRPAPGGLLRPAGAVVAGACALLLLAQPAVSARLGEPVGGFLESLRESRLNDLDMTELERGYYEDLLDVDRFNSQLWEVYMKKPAGWPSIYETPAVRMTGDFLKYELRPDLATEFHDRPFTTNRWGMRDRDYALEKPAGVRRIALLGSSNVMGSGVADDETFESLLEERLAAEGRRIEILNFAVEAYRPLQQLVVLERALPFDPDAVVYVAHSVDENQSINHLSQAARFGIEIPHPFLVDVLRRAGVDRTTPPHEAKPRLAPFQEEIVRFTYERLVETCRARSVVPVWVFLPLPEEHAGQREVAHLLRAARQAGFVVVDLSGVYAGRDLDEIRVAEWDDHANALAHRIVAARLHDVLRARQHEIVPPGGTP